MSEARRFAEEAFEGARPPKYRGLTRAARIGQIIAEDVRGGERTLEQTLRDVLQANSLTFEPPYSDAKIEALAQARCEAEGVDVG